MRKSLENRSQRANNSERKGIIMLRYIRPTMPPSSEIDLIMQQAYDAKWYSNFGGINTEFEKQIDQYFCPNGRKAITVSNATDGLAVALLALGIEGKVVIPSFTFAATGQALFMASCTPVFCDCSADTWELCPKDLENILSTESNIRGIIHVRVFGMSHRIDPIEQIAKKYGIPLIVDSAACLGAHFKGNHFIGAQGDLEVFSLHATKVFGVGEGGVIMTPEKLYYPIKRLTNFGIEGEDILSVGLNAKLSEVQAATGIAVLKYIEGFIMRRNEIAGQYYNKLKHQQGVVHCWPASLSCWQSYPLLLDNNICIESLIENARSKGLELKRGYSIPLHQSTAFRAFSIRPLPITEWIGRQVVCLPVYSDMTEEESKLVIEIFLTSLSEEAKSETYISS